MEIDPELAATGVFDIPSGDDKQLDDPVAKSISSDQLARRGFDQQAFEAERAPFEAEFTKTISSARARAFDPVARAEDLRKSFATGDRVTGKGDMPSRPSLLGHEYTEEELTKDAEEWMARAGL